MKKDELNVPSISYIIITPLESPAEPPKVKNNLGSNSFYGGDCFNGNTLNCVFDQSETPKIKCDGLIVKIPAKSNNKQLACMNKCIKST